MQALMRKIEKWVPINFRKILMFHRQKFVIDTFFKNNTFDSLKKIPTLHGNAVNRAAAVPPFRFFIHLLRC